jgi:glycosyltransferase involved in cell wall biosynthesis
VDRSRLGIVIPAFNEAATIGRVVEGARQFGTVIVVDDASSDATATVAIEHGADIVRLTQNAGYDRALQSGAERAKALGCTSFITLDGDGQHDPAAIGTFVDLLCAGADVVIGSRDQHQRFAEWLFAFIGRWLWQIDDPLCGMKCYRMSVYDTLGHFDSYGSIGTELAIHAASSGRSVSNVPILTRPRAGASRFGAGFRSNVRILRALIRGVGRAYWNNLSAMR